MQGSPLLKKYIRDVYAIPSRQELRAMREESKQYASQTYEAHQRSLPSHNDYKIVPQNSYVRSPLKYRKPEPDMYRYARIEPQTTRNITQRERPIRGAASRIMFDYVQNKHRNSVQLNIETKNPGALSPIRPATCRGYSAFRSGEQRTADNMRQNIKQLVDTQARREREKIAEVERQRLRSEREERRVRSAGTIAPLIEIKLDSSDLKIDDLERLHQNMKSKLEYEEQLILNLNNQLEPNSIEIEKYDIDMMDNDVDEKESQQEEKSDCQQQQANTVGPNVNLDDQQEQKQTYELLNQHIQPAEDNSENDTQPTENQL